MSRESAADMIKALRATSEGQNLSLADPDWPSSLGAFTMLRLDGRMADTGAFLSDRALDPFDAASGSGRLLLSLDAGFSGDAVAARKRLSSAFDASAETKEMSVLRFRSVLPEAIETQRPDSVTQLMAEASVLSNGFGIDYLTGVARLLERNPDLSFDTLTSWIDRTDPPRTFSNVVLLLALYVLVVLKSRGDAGPETCKGQSPRHASFVRNLGATDGDNLVIRAQTALFFGGELVDHSVFVSDLFDYLVLACINDDERAVIALIGRRFFGKSHQDAA